MSSAPTWLSRTLTWSSPQLRRNSCVLALDQVYLPVSHLPSTSVVSCHFPPQRVVMILSIHQLLLESLSPNPCPPLPSPRSHPWLSSRPPYGENLFFCVIRVSFFFSLSLPPLLLPAPSFALHHPSFSAHSTKLSLHTCTHSQYVCMLQWGSILPESL